MLIKGSWTADPGHVSSKGTFARGKDLFGAPLGRAVLQSLRAVPDRYALVVSHSCPWSHRVTIARAIHNAPVATITAGEPRDQGYSILDTDGLLAGSRGRITRAHQLYTRARPDYTGRATVPLLWDRRDETVLSNSSAHIVAALDEAFGTDGTLFPADLTDEIERLSEKLYSGLSNAVYEAGFARTQDAYDRAAARVFETMDWLNEHLSNRRFLLGSRVTAADLHVFPTLVRFDLVYGPLFQCTRRRLRDYPALWAYTRDVHQLSGIDGTVFPDAILAGYYLNDTDRNPHRIISQTPDMDWPSRGTAGVPEPVPLAPTGTQIKAAI